MFVYIVQMVLLTSFAHFSPQNETCENLQCPAPHLPSVLPVSLSEVRVLWF